MTANIALKRQMFTLSHFTEGNIPESLIGVPDSWTPDQIKNFQDYWDAYFTGDLAARRRAKFVPGGVAKTFIQTKEPELKGVFDEWLARIVCYAFSRLASGLRQSDQSLDRRDAKGDGGRRGAVAGSQMGEAADRRRVDRGFWRRGRGVRLGRGRADRRRPAGASADELRRRGDSDAQRSAGETGRGAGGGPGGECADGDGRGADAGGAGLTLAKTTSNSLQRFIWDRMRKSTRANRRRRQRATSARGF